MSDAPFIVLDVDGVLHPLRASGHPLRASMADILARGEREEALDAADPEDLGGRTGETVDGEFVDECTTVLAEIVQSVGAKIVLSSTWRETAPQRRAVNSQLARHGISAIVGWTGSLSGPHRRAEEILAWAAEQQRSSSAPCCWVALDDQEGLDQFLPAANLVQTDPARGLTAEDGERALECLRQQRRAILGLADEVDDAAARRRRRRGGMQRSTLGMRASPEGRAALQQELLAEDEETAREDEQRVELHEVQQSQRVQEEVPRAGVPVGGSDHNSNDPPTGAK